MATKPNPGKVALAIIGGAAGAALVTGAVLSALMLAGHAPVGWVTWIFLYVFVIALMFATTIGLVWHILAFRRGWTSMPVYLLPGLVVGLFVIALILLTPGTPHAGPPSENWGRAGAVFLIPIGALTGAMTGAFAWLIRRPDRDANLAKPAP